MADRDGNGVAKSDGTKSNTVGTTDGVIIVDPAAVRADAFEQPAVRSGIGPNGRKLNKDGTERKARGTSAGQGGSGPATRTEKAPFSVNGVAFSLTGIHALLATTLKTPELLIEKQEAEHLARAIGAVQRHYDINVTEKSADWFSLILALTTVYGTRVGAISLRMKKEAQERNAQRGATVVPFPGRPVPRPAPPVQTQQVAPTLSPDGDPVAVVPNVTEAPKTMGDAAFAQTPPELI